MGKLTPSQAAKQLGTDPGTLARLARDGRITSSRTKGGQRRYDADEMSRFAGMLDAARKTSRGAR